MCILFAELCASPLPEGFRLILATNRDESLRRPAVKLHRWEDTPNVLGGRDQEAGRELGTWLAMDTAGSGRVGTLLNVMGGGISPDKRNRGFIVVDLLRDSGPTADYFERLSRKGLEFNPFHLTAIDLDPSSGGIWHYSNRSERDGQDSGVTHLKEGRFCLGNSPLTRPFKKVQAGEERFQESVRKWGRQETRDTLTQELLQLLKWEKQHLPDAELEMRGQRAGAPPESWRRSSAVFQYHPEREYGTRTHTIILVDSNWRCDFHEWTKEEPVDPNSKWIHTHEVIQLSETNNHSTSCREQF